MRRLLYSLKKQFHTFDLLPAYFREVRLHFLDVTWGIGVGAGVPYMIFGLYSLFKTPPPIANWLAIVGAIFLSGYYLWRADHLRLQPKLCISNVVRDEWSTGFPANAPSKAILWYFPVSNISEGTTITGINVQLNKIEPSVDNLDWLPVHLHIKHDNPSRPEDSAKTFDLNPNDTRNVDFVAAIARGDTFELRHILPPVINHHVPRQKYRIQVMVTAHNLPALFRWFEVWADDNEELQCRLIEPLAQEVET